MSNLDSDPLTWWNSRQLVYPLICKLIKAVHCIVATSVPSESVPSESVPSESVPSESVPSVQLIREHHIKQ